MSRGKEEGRDAFLRLCIQFLGNEITTGKETGNNHCTSRTYILVRGDRKKQQNIMTRAMKKSRIDWLFETWKTICC